MSVKTDLLKKLLEEYSEAEAPVVSRLLEQLILKMPATPQRELLLQAHHIFHECLMREMIRRNMV